jgi:dienelactone hydrolase
MAALAAAVAPAALAAAQPGTPNAAPAPGSPEYLARDAANIAAAYGRQTAPDGQRSPAYIQAAHNEQGAQWFGQLFEQMAAPMRPALDPGEVVPGWNSGNPFRYGWSGKRGLTVPVSFTNRYGALLRGDVFAPLPGARDPYTHERLRPPYPGVVFTTGSIQGSERMYWWLAQDLAERGYVVLTYDVQGQGRSETVGHEGPVEDLPYCNLAAPQVAGETSPCPGVPFQQTSNFVYGTEDAIDFFLSTPRSPYKNPHAAGADVNAHNPLWKLFDRSADRRTATPGRTTRLAIAGHSLGASAVSYVQAIDKRVAAVVALDKLSSDSTIGDSKPGTPSVPGLGVQSEYGFNVAPYFANPGLRGGGFGSPMDAPDPNREESTGYDGWKKAGVDTMVIVPRASTHLEYTDIPWVLPASRYGQDVASYYTQAWLGKYLKHDPRATRALLATKLHYLEPSAGGVWKPVTLRRADNLSFYFCSGYALHARGDRRVNDDIGHVGC